MVIEDRAQEPARMSPAAAVTTRRRLDGWESDPAGLLDWLRPQLTPTQLDSIARADFGDVEANLTILRDIQASGLISQPLGGYLPASLEFIRWTAKTDHVMRAFACALLLLEAAGPTWRAGDEATMAILIESCLALGDEAMARAVGLLVTMVEAYAETRHELPFAYLGVLIAAAARDPRDPRLPRVVEQLIDAAAVASGYGADVPRVDWLLDQTRYDSKHKAWRKLAARCLGEPSREDPSLGHLAEIAERLRAQPILPSG